MNFIIAGYTTHQHVLAVKQFLLSESAIQWLKEYLELSFRHILHSVKDIHLCVTNFQTTGSILLYLESQLKDHRLFDQNKNV